MISVVIPAHDEAAVIERCLSRLVDGAPQGALEVIVVCNGCRDDTALRAQDFGPPVRVLSVDEASKARALQLGDREARSFPRFFIDADVVVSFPALRDVARRLTAGDALAAAPRAEVDMRPTTWPVRAFYRVWTRLPYFDGSMVGSGVYALSEEGRRRFGRFPEVIADDEFIRRQFRPGERLRVDTCRFTITPPSSVSGLLADKTRSRLGLYQLDRQFPELRSSLGLASWLRQSTRALLGRPTTWPSLPVYACVTLLARLRASRRAAAGDFDGWGRHPTSRPPTPPDRLAEPSLPTAAEPPRGGAIRR